jgi:uncharacterized protein
MLEQLELLRSLLIYRNLLDDPVGQAFLQLHEGLLTQDPRRIITGYGQWFMALSEQGVGWQEYLLTRLVNDDNSFSRAAALGKISMPLAMGAGRDMQVVQQLYGQTCEAIAKAVNHHSQLPVPVVAWTDWLTHQGPLQPLRKALESSEDWTEALPVLVETYRQRGTGIFGQYWAFRWQAGDLLGVAHPDPIRIDNLIGYDWQCQALRQNTEALIRGHGGLNVLLYGSRGSGKSSLVKSLVGAYGGRGLRLVEIAKDDLADLPQVVERVRSRPQKFIFFVDDLSFEADEEQFKALKVVLEGGITARPKNVVVYATSNRRHLIREYFTDRPNPRDQDELSNWDTVQEKLSFSDRFGLTLTFEPASQDAYLAIVDHLVKQAGLQIDGEMLSFRALQWATQQNGRSGRTARQFVDFLVGEVG